MKLFVNIASNISKAKKLPFSISPIRQKFYINKLQASNDFERGYCQYRCQMALQGRLIAFFYNIVSVPLIVLYIIKLINKDKKFKRPNIKSNYALKAIFLHSGNASILPLTLKKKYNIIQIKRFQQKLILNAEDRAFIFELWRKYPLEFYFCFKSMLKVAMYRYQITLHNPDAIIVTEEYSFTSSVLTEYCNRNGIKHINVMHGEKLYYIRDSFFHFHECYIWDEHYRRIFIDLKAEPSQFIVEIPPCLEPWKSNVVNKCIDYTYYLGAEDTKELKKIKQVLSLLVNKGAIVAIRPHPIYSSLKKIHKIFDRENGFIIERNDDISIEASVLRTRYAVSCYSTVLLQAVNNGVKVVLDDVTDREKFERLKELHYICFKRDHLLLSKVLLDNGYQSTVVLKE